MQLLSSAKARDVSERELERVRQWYGFYVVGYVVMPEHVHLLVSEPERGTLGSDSDGEADHLSQTAPEPERVFRSSGKFGITVFRCGLKRSAWRNCATSIVIRFIVDSLPSQKIGSGVALSITRQERKVQSRLNRTGQRVGEREWVSRRYP